ncbi:MAG: glutamate racemase [Roseburia sp.]|uniref:glutamate racemase n=1 Tax=Roseburia sp. 831b TaxID=1261635 RepID=UPI000952923E|nr:glutamate racemase [Roseburia sp. 831b]MCI5920315.1 glutamate racemase [Roseburia sp.]MDD6217345.1 glutamate racemase [Roseburia sp.]MDY5884561.1 glutamate racemase [Roseburia sp.]WVK72304.1 glutamate racemase [Roseburia sp. 831b]
MEQMQQPIGVFDSGLGGISVLRELVAFLPNENYLYLGDSKHAPYGTKSLQEVQKLTCNNIEYLIGKGAKAIVVACNTATSAAIQILREHHKDMPIIGIEPALKPAVLQKEHPNVLVMATPMTLREEKFHALMKRYENEAEIISLPCPGLVEFVERGELEGEALEAYFKELFAPFADKKIDSAVLGCTHYPLVKNVIQKMLGDSVTLFDGGEGTAHETYRRLKEKNLLNTTPQKGTVIFENTEGTEQKTALAKQLLWHTF